MLKIFHAIALQGSPDRQCLRAGSCILSTQMAGYSKRSLVEKLGIKPSQKIYFGNAPENYNQTLGVLPKDAVLLKSLEGPCGFIQFFTKDKAELESAFPKLKQGLAPDGSL